MTVVPVAAEQPVLTRRQLDDEATRIAFLWGTSERIDALADLVDQALRSGAAGVS